MFLQNANQATNSSGGIVGNASEITNVTWRSIDNLVTSIVEKLPYIIAGILVLLIFYGLAKLIKSIFWLATKHTRLDHRLRILFSRVISVFVVILGIFTAMTVMVDSFRFGDLIAGLGFTSFVIGFATKDILNNLLSGVLILWQQPFRIGDQIFIGSNQGKVEYIGVRATSLRKDDGELVLIPNGDMYSHALTIRGAGAKRRMSLKFAIGYEADIAEAKKIIHKSLRGIGKIVEDPEERVVVTDLTSDGVNITVYFWLNTNENRPMDVFDEAATAVKTSLMAKRVEIFPPGSLIVQRPREEAPEPEPGERAKKNGGF
jgi:small conductance mechanosensitive channel